MAELATCSYRAYRSGYGLAVVTSLGLPKWRPEAASWPRAWVLTPTAALLRLDDEKFAREYVARLDTFGPQKISRTLHRISEENGAERLVLLCHESDPSRCHRGLWARWWLVTTGEVVDVQ